MTTNSNTWRSVLAHAFENIMQGPMQYSGNYWQQGCTFDTVLDYLKFSIESASTGDRRQKIEEAQKAVQMIYKNVYQNEVLGGVWYDDWAWWGIASTKAYDPAYAEVFGTENAEKFERVARFCYETMISGKGRNEKPGAAGRYHGAQNVWETCNQTYYRKVKPRYPGGSWQDDFPVASSGSPSDLGPLDPSNHLGFFQVSVMNGLFLVFSSQLSAVAGFSATGAAEQYRFIQSWINYAPTPNQGLLNTENIQGVLVRERVSSYASDKMPVNFYKPTTCWGGDQGLFMGGLLAYEKYDPTDSTKSLIRKIVTGVSLNMLDAHQAPSQVMGPWYPFHDNPLAAIDPGDYSSGVGVFMRYLLLAYTKCPSLILDLLSDPSTGLREMLTHTAKYYAQRPAPTPISGTPDIFICFNQLSALLTAVKLLD